jgi:hypothetical protein
MIIKKTGTEVGADANAYSTGDLIGGLLTLSGADSIGGLPPFLTSITLQDLDKQNVAIDVVFFDANPTGTTFTNNAALDIADADLPKVIAVIPVTTYFSFNDNSVATVNALGGIAMNAAGGPTIYACLVSRGAPTYSASGLSALFGFAQ